MALITRTISLSQEIAINPSRAFACITDLAGYNTWLPQSDAFKGTTEISDNPIKVGTRYIETSPNGTRYGEVTALDEGSCHVRFHQPLKARPEIMGLQIDIVVDMRVDEGPHGGCVLQREMALGFPWIMWPLVGFITRQVELEVRRVVQVLKEHLEAKG
ncbi:hypothetical protein F5X68DRAFT_247918 [Plectosphaerella plurivora]|uniref:SRPBCC family protein n=1 Tax=Plectosphaerella plurivora TaxID=936078 RepID=A0A9P9AGE7_9PEZI|nr:hypothetical protein F5X68DRAFT_247918 [Plectosphaerella plurivora]